ncbi:glycosyltransferase family 2 protein [Tateyamaria sp. ANG-S1]|uniref:glycosyltransferase family 2 protein n=1 Tax=Tateyamaria sp. ANG-S1 TaxID=1577905 RepID=UPI00187C2F8B|nr:glycosyltransferase family 2 protein [Tateyamaria sp. ANG-S1]
MRWGVVLTANEPVALVETNVRWHLATGAAAVHVFLDDPDDPAADVLSGIPGCKVQRCDEAYWRARRPNKGRPLSQMRRQTINANRAQNRCDLDWLFHIDADEFIWQDGDLADELASHGEPQTEVNLPVLERIFPKNTQSTLFEGAFRASSDLSPEEAEAALAPFTGFMKRGQYSHGAGKSGVQVGAGLRLGVHNATRTGSAGRQRRAAKRVSSTARLLHFDGMTPLHWLMKVLRYRQTPPEVQVVILQPHRAEQIAWMLENANTLQDAQAAHRTLFAMTDARHAQLARFDLLHDIPFDPVRVIGPACPDLSIAAFDADVLRRNPQLATLLNV